jgi:formate/nitrite transporter FocA (FNT family)
MPEPETSEPEGMELTEKEKEQVDEKKQPRAQVLYEAIRREGEHELSRSAAALVWSGLAAGLSMGFSVIAMALLKVALPDAPWAKLIVNLGYGVGFVTVIVARQQLFTENTLTPVIPLLQHKDLATLRKLLRLWGLVLTSNLVGTFALAFVLERSAIFPGPVKAAFAEFGHVALTGSFSSHLLRGVLAGWMVALMVWMLAGDQSRTFLIFLMTYIIGLGELSHIIAGSTETFYLVCAGEVSLLEYGARFLLPVGVGNVVGGTLLVALLSHAQVAADSEGQLPER